MYKYIWKAGLTAGDPANSMSKKVASGKLLC